MIHTLYSNTYEVLKVALLHNLGVLDREHAEADVFESTPVLVPSHAVDSDLTREIAERQGVCAGWEFMTPSAWMGFFAKAPLANVVGNEAEWMIWRVLRETGSSSFRERTGHERLKTFLSGKNDLEICLFSRRVAALFTVYTSYRADWVFRWLGTGKGVLGDEGRWQREQRQLAASPDYLWQVHLWEVLAANPLWQGQRFLENFVDNLQKLATVPVAEGGKNTTLLALEAGRRVLLPNVLHVFMPFVIPPLMLPILKALALSGRDIWFYILNPSDEFWFDSTSMIQLGADKRAEAEARNIHPLLFADAGSMRANIDRLWQFTQEGEGVALLDERNDPEFAPPPEHELKWDIARFNAVAQDLRLDMDMSVARQSCFIERRGDSLLSRIQDSLLNNRAEDVLLEDGTLGLASDDSLRLWNAPTAIRQWEAVAEAIVTLFAKDPTLKPSDILVLTPDVSLAAPLVDKAFKSLPKAQRFAWRMSGLAPIASEELAQAISGLATLITGRAPRDALESWLSLPPVAKRFGLTSDDLLVLGSWLRAAGYREGISDAHLQGCDAALFSYDTEMTLMRAVERLTLGYVYPDDEGLPFGDVLPKRGNELDGFTVTADRLPLLETLAEIATTLEDFRAATSEKASAGYWGRWLMRAVNAFFDSPEMLTGVKRSLTELMAELRLAAKTEAERQDGIELEFALFMQALAAKFETAAGAASAGPDVTVSSMEALRGLPHRVVFIVGLDVDCGFPGVSRREEFDLTAVAPRRGDRDARRDKRNLFLDWLLAARDRLIITYTTSAKKSDALVMQPSVVVQELRDWLLGLVKDHRKREAEAAFLTEMLPLARYSEENFSSDGSLWHSHDERTLAAVERARAASAAQVPSAAAPYFNAALPPRAELPAGWLAGDPGRLLLPAAVLARFAKAPEKWLAQEQGVRILSDPEEDRDSVWPKLDGLGAWTLANEVSQSLGKGESLDSIRLRQAADPTGGAKSAREWLVRASMNEAVSLVRAYEGMRATLTPMADIDLSVPLMPSATGEPSVVITSPVRQRYEELGASGERRAVLLKLNAAKHLSQRDVLDWLCLNALEMPSALMEFARGSTEPLVLSALSANVARWALERIVAAFLASCRAPAALPEASTRTATLALLFGRASSQGTDERAKALDGIAGFKDEDAFVAKWKAYCDMLDASATSANVTQGAQP